MHIDGEAGIGCRVRSKRRVRVHRFWSRTGCGQQLEGARPMREAREPSAGMPCFSVELISPKVRDSPSGRKIES